MNGASHDFGRMTPRRWHPQTITSTLLCDRQLDVMVLNDPEGGPNMPPLDDNKLLQVVDRIYDAAVSPELWPGILIEISSVVGGCGAYLFSSTRPEQELAWGVVGGLDPEAHGEYDRYYAPLDFRTPPTLRMPVGTLYTNETLCDWDSLTRSQIYHELLTKYDLVHLGGVILARTERQQTQISIQRREKDGPFEERQCRLIQLLAPHLCRAVELQNRLERLGAHHAGLREVVDRLPVGACLFNDRGALLHMNRAAEQILQRGDGLVLRDHELTCASPRGARELRRLICSAVTSTKTLVTDPGSVVRVPRRNIANHYAVLVLPLGTGTAECTEGAPSGVGFIFDSDTDSSSSPEVLRMLYSFTDAESRLASLLMAGATVAEAAEQTRISLNTARTHLKHIFLKAGVSRQSELMRELLTGPALFLDRRMGPSR